MENSTPKEDDISLGVLLIVGLALVIVGNFKLIENIEN